MKMKSTKFLTCLLLLLSLSLSSSFVACSGGGSGSESDQLSRRGGSDAANFDCDGECPNQILTEADVSQILRQAVGAAEVLGTPATIAVLDRTSNVLAVYQMDGAQTTSVVTAGTGAQGGAEGAVVPAAFCAISKAGTCTNFSSQGNAFNTRSAGQLLQENFLPSEDFAPSGPLFGVQFSQGLCSDINPINPELAQGLPIGPGQFTAGGLIGPRPQPIGFAGDPGSIPLYKQGDVVGAIGVEANGVYTVDRKVSDIDDEDILVEERIAMSGAIGFEPPSERVASVISVRGKSLRLTDLEFSELAPLPEPLPELSPGNFLSLPFFTNGVIRRGARYSTAESGILRIERGGILVEIVVDEAGNNRFPAIDGAPLPGGVELKANEVDALLQANMIIATRTRSQVRRPLGTDARVAVWIVDTQGTPVGFLRSRDTILDSTDVTLQKARSSAFFSSPDAGALLRQAGLGGFVDRATEILGREVFDGSVAWSTTALGNISRPFFPDGVFGNPPGPFSLPVPGTPGATDTFSVFNTGLQFQLYSFGFLPPLSSPPVVPVGCTDPAVFGQRIRNGVTFFPGAFPLYRDGVLIGAIASSGDGTEQDDLIPFYASSRVGLDEAGFPNIGDPELGFNAPKEIRADNIDVAFPQTNLRYVACPESPFLGTNDQNVCAGF